MDTVELMGLQCVELANDHISMLITQSVGPRVISLRAGRGENLFVELPGVTLDCPGKGPFHLYGGHRLWHAPEDPARTYLPDDQPVRITEVNRGLRVEQAAETETGLQKSLQIRLAPAAAEVQVVHEITNQGMWPVTCALWAITQLKPGGVGLLPQYQGLMEENPTLPNRTLALWPYTDITSPFITWADDLVLVHARMDAGMLKLGFPNPRGWLGYWRAGTLFVKRAAYDPLAGYYDFGSSSECYCNDKFIELETLGPITEIQPGETVTHVETWEVYFEVSWPEDPVALVELIEGEKH